MSVINLPVESNKYNWIDVVNPTKDELKQLSEQYRLHHYTLKDCLEPDHLPKHEDLGDTQFIITRILTPSPNYKLHTVQEISSKIAIFYNE